jgi:hypothetical protein
LVVTLVPNVSDPVRRARDARRSPGCPAGSVRVACQARRAPSVAAPCSVPAPSPSEWAAAPC